MTELLFDFEEMITEVDAFSYLAAPFLAPETKHVLEGLKQSLNVYRDVPTVSAFDWEISLNDPLKTIVSDGGYEVGGGGQHRVFGEITAKWQIRRVPLTKRRQRSKQFKLIGLASTRVRLLCETVGRTNPQELAMWRMEVGDRSAPGCHFHTQVLGSKPDGPFPNSLPVPRLPGLILTPMAVVEFVLAEIFQDDWARHVGRDSPHLKRWAPIQRQRFERLLQWKLAIVKESSSPWTTMKKEKPSAELFI